MELYIMRHGQTADNKKHLLQGRKNIPLSEEGIEQAMQAKADLDAEGIRFDRVCASPLKRAMQTASLITGVDESDIEPIEEIIEYDFGPLEGKRVEDLGPNMRELFMDPEAFIAPEGAETYDEMFKRVEEYLKR
ncbi:MAG: histidine phosphatase family protein, partial [Clostridia bacterium]|nr:histidine phosphatase family protein [Clostridia bacterium]